MRKTTSLTPEKLLYCLQMCEISACAEVLLSSNLPFPTTFRTWETGFRNLPRVVLSLYEAYIKDFQHFKKPSLS